MLRLRSPLAAPERRWRCGCFRFGRRVRRARPPPQLGARSKLFLTTLALLFHKGTAVQISIACTWSLVFLVVHVSFEPSHLFEKREDNRLQALPLSSLIQVRPTAGQSVLFAVLLSVLSVVVALLAVPSSALRACKDSAGVDGRNHANLTCCTPAFSCCRRRRMLDDPPNVV